MIQINRETAYKLKGEFFNDFNGNAYLISFGKIFEIVAEDGEKENNKRPITELV